MSCWRAREQRRARAAQAEDDRLLWESIGELDAVAALEQACGACGDTQASPTCWLCGYAWLRQLRARFAADQEAAAEAEESRYAAIAERTEAEERVADLTGWIARIQRTLALYESGGGGRAVELVADLLARLDADAAGRTTRRGRPPMTPQVATVLAVDADWSTGRRSLPGRERSAWLLGCSDRAIYDAWKKVAELEWATRTCVGGRNSKERRIETGRPNDRAEFDLVQLHRSTVPVATRARFVAPALELLGDVLARALVVLDREQDALDTARARTDTWTDWTELTHRAQLRAAVARTRDTLTGPIPAAHTAANTCRTHPVSQGEYLSSCSYWGLQFSPKIMIHSPGCGLRPNGRGEGGASLSSTKQGQRAGAECPSCASPPLNRPRTTEGAGRTPRARTAPAWAAWAYPLARELVKRWTWLRGEQLPRVAATLGARLGPDWTAHDVVQWVTEHRTRPVLDDPRNPLGYLRQLLDEALADGTEPPWRARRHDDVRRHRETATAAATTAGLAARRATWDARATDAAAAAATGTGRAAMSAIRAQLAARQPGTGNTRRRPAVPIPDHLAQRAATPTSDPATATATPQVNGWPRTAQPGEGAEHLRR